MKHWTRDDITQWLYGLHENASHLDRCDLCAREAASAKSRRQEFLAAFERQGEDVPQQRLAAQRRAIYQRLEQPRPSFWNNRVAASLALALLMAVLSFKMLDQRSAYVPLINPSDERLYSEMVAIDQSSEPRAIQPLEKLFEK